MGSSLFDIAPLEPLIRAGYTLLTPNQRLARRLRSEWDRRQVEAGERAWESLPAQPLEAFLLARWEQAQREGLLAPRTLLTRQQELLLWQDAIEQHTRDGGGPVLLRPSGAAEQASEARDLLLRYQLDPGTARNTQLFGLEADCSAFLAWLALFEERLASSGYCTAADALVALAGVAGRLGPLELALVECGDVAPLLQACLDGLCKDLQIRVSSGPGAACLVHPFPDGRAELRGVAAWAARVHRESPATTVGIVIAGAGRVGIEYLLRREFDCLGANYVSLPVNFSTGISLAEAPAIRDALAVLSLGLEEVRVAQVVALLRSRFLDLPDADSALAAHFVTRLFEGGNERLSLRALGNFASSVYLADEEGLALGRHLAAISRMRELQRPAPPSEWVARFEAMLDEWGWPGPEPLDSLEYQQVKRWYETLDEFRVLDTVRPGVTHAEALGLLRESCLGKVSHPRTADSPIQVLGPLEAVGLSFDHLWICGMQAAAWPSPPRPNPFIPMALQIERQLPHASPEREWRFGETLLQQYRRACTTVHASYSRQVDGVADLPSALLEGFEEQVLEEGAPVYPDWSRAMDSAASESLADNRAPGASPGELAALRGGAALIEHQSQCPFRAFAQHRLKARPLPVFAPGISNAERGQVVHEALHVLWSRFTGHGDLLAAPEERRAALVKEAAGTGVESIPLHRRIALGPTCLALEESRLEALLAEWLALEAARGEFVVRALEEDIVLELDQLVVRLRVDRVDELPDGSRVIIDYKTGRSRVSDWLGERPPNPQLLLYGLAAASPPAALAFAQVRPGACLYAGIGDIDTAAIAGIATDIPAVVGDSMAARDWEALNREWADTLHGLARAFVAGDATVDPLQRDSCTWCGLQPLCRVAFDESWEEEA